MRLLTALIAVALAGLVAVAGHAVQTGAHPERASLEVSRAAVRAGGPAIGGVTARKRRWVPRPSITWQWQLTGPLDLSVPASLYDVDLYDTPASTVAKLHARRRHVICYLDAGTYERGRPDSGSYPDAVLGNSLSDYPDERWLDIRRLDVLGPLIKRRLDLCRGKGFDGVEFDNVDGYSNDSGFPLTAADQLRFNRYLARAAHARGLSAALKNDVDQAGALVRRFDFALVEQCFQYHECDRLRPFRRAGKAVLIAEYELPAGSFCAQARASGYRAMRKHIELDAWREPCW